MTDDPAFLDGNKRTAIGAALTFLRINGVIVPDATADLHGVMIAIAERRLGKIDLAALLRYLAS